MKTVHRSGRRGRVQRGVSLIELMIGLAIGLLSTIVIAGVMWVAESQKRTTVSGSDAQVVGSIALYELQRQLEKSGYGVANVQSALNCAIKAQYEGKAAGGMAGNLQPVLITDGVGGLPDTIRVMYSRPRDEYGGLGMAAPLRIEDLYDPAQRGADGKAFYFAVASSVSVRKGDLLLAANHEEKAGDCELFEAGEVTKPNQIPRPDTAKWNAAGWPSRQYDKRDFLINLGQLADLQFQVDTATHTLQRIAYSTNVAAAGVPEAMHGDVVNLQAMYGKDTDGDDIVDLYDNVTPIDHGGWTQVRAVRIAVVVRSNQYEKSETLADGTQRDVSARDSVDWYVGTGAVVAGASACKEHAGTCVPISVAHVADYQHFRYKVFDTVVPLRNLIWSNDVAKKE